MNAFTINFQEYLLLLAVLIVNIILIYGVPVPPGDKARQNSPNYNCWTGECIRLANKDLDMFETDIDMDKEQDEFIESLEKGQGSWKTSLQAVSSNPTRYWPNAIVPYTLDKKLDKDIEAHDLIQQAIDHWENYTCIRFVPKNSTHSNWIIFVRKIGCFSKVGRQEGQQVVSIGWPSSYCRTVGIVIHELGHVIGFWHEQSRPDRDQYIEVKWDNIKKGHDRNFFIYSTDSINSYNITYDYSSIMHYSSYAFSSNGMPTIVPKQKNVKMGQQKRLSPLDIIQANIIYNCTARATPAPPLNKNNHSSIPDQRVQPSSFVIYNPTSNKCLAIKELKHGYSVQNPIDSIWEVVMTNCHPKDAAQVWTWSNESHLVHESTGLCMSESNGKTVLEKCQNTTWNMKWLCAGYFIEQPHTEHCLATEQSPLVHVKSLISKVQEVVLEEALEDSLSQQSLDYELKLLSCNVTDMHQKWTLYSKELKSPDNNNFTTICSAAPSHKVSDCYTESNIDANKWLRCSRYGYYVSGLKYSVSKITSLICCASPYTFWGNKSIDTKQSGNPGDCYHRNWWTTVTQSKFQCHPGEYLHGIFFDTLTGSFAECCLLNRQIQFYRHCEKVDDSNMCTRKGYHISGLYESDCSPYKECAKQLQCCV